MTGFWDYRGYIVALLFFIIGMMYKSNRIVTVLYSIYMWMLIAFNTNTPDYSAYESMYIHCNEPSYALHEPFYLLINKLCLRLGFSYVQFRMVAAAIIVILLVKGICHLTTHQNHTLALMLIFPFVSYVSGLRNSISAAIFIYSVHFLIKNDRKDLIKYIICVLVAATFHYASLFYLIYIYARISKQKTLSMLGLVTLITVFAVLVTNTGILYSIASRFTQSEKVLQWLKGSGTEVSGLYIASIMLIMVLLYFIQNAKHSILARMKSNVLYDSAITGNSLMLINRIIILSMIAFSGAIFSSVVFLRLVLTPIPAAYCVLSEALYPYKNDSIDIKKNNLIIRVLFCIFIAFVTAFVFGFWIGGDMLTIYVGNSIFS